MGINLKPNRTPSRMSNQGFTLMELMIALVVSLLALGAIYSTFQSQHKSYRVQQETADMHQNIRAAMYYMQREIRMAGCDPIGIANARIITANATKINFTEDVFGNTPGSNPDGATDDPNEDITYSLDAHKNLMRDTGGGNKVVAQNIDALDFVYLDGASPPNVLNPGGIDVPAADLSKIRAVEVTIVARTNDPLLYGTQNNRKYLNQQGTQIYAAPGDHVSRRILTSYIKCRNLGL
ncbi:MAG: prepilin-type N-terminal cleavage/methylation domain-containing protein [Desulfobacterales bacterium]|nr:prepilin-type N-terminal cleavage/methylation domain-containing protein [Desulfobacterales bacterium]